MGAVVALVSAWLGAMSSPSPATGPAPEGEVIDTGTGRLYMRCIGSGRPSVVFDAGLGGLSLEWEPVQHALAGITRTCAYDRAGLGRSDATPKPRTSSEMVDELRALLRAHGIAPPYVLVGHSFGGYNAQLFARRYPGDTAGMVLVDASHPQQVQRFLAPPIKVNIAPSDNRRIMFLAPPSIPSSLPAHLKSMAADLSYQNKSMVTVSRELLNFRRSARQVRASRPFPEIPLVVVTRGRNAWPDDNRGQLMENLWRQLQVELSWLSPHSAHLIAQHSGHHIHLDQPQLVSDAVRLVLSYISEAHRLTARHHYDLWVRSEKAPRPRFVNATWVSNSLAPTYALLH